MVWKYQAMVSLSQPLLFNWLWDVVTHLLWFSVLSSRKLRRHLIKWDSVEKKKQLRSSVMKFIRNISSNWKSACYFVNVTKILSYPDPLSGYYLVISPFLMFVCISTSYTGDIKVDGTEPSRFFKLFANLIRFNWRILLWLINPISCLFF